MADLSGKFVIMLTGYLELYPDQWPITHQDDTIEAARQRQQFDSDPWLVPKTSLHAVEKEAKSLIYTPDGSEHAGHIYEMSLES